MISPQDLLHVALVGAGATLVMDTWLLLLKRLGVPTLNFSLLGRWAAHVARGRMAHGSIAAARPVAGERAIGWLAHYAVGVAFAAVLVGVQGTAWLHAPSVLPALAFGLASVAMPLFVMQPAMGLGIASSKTPAPLKSCLRSLANHAVFGSGLYLAAFLLKGLHS